MHILFLGVFQTIISLKNYLKIKKQNYLYINKN